MRDLSLPIKRLLSNAPKMRYRSVAEENLQRQNDQFRPLLALRIVGKTRQSLRDPEGAVLCGKAGEYQLQLIYKEYRNKMQTRECSWKPHYWPNLD